MAENATKNKRNFDYMLQVHVCLGVCVFVCVFASLKVSTSDRQQHHFDTVAGDNFRVSKSVVSVSCHSQPTQHQL